MHVFTNAELTAQVADLQQQLTKALETIAKHRGQQNTTEAAEAIYQAYPRKIGKAAAIKAINKATAKIHPRSLRDKVNEYAKAIAWQENRSFVPHPATWFNGERWLDDPKEWEQPTQGKNGIDPTKSILG